MSGLPGTPVARDTRPPAAGPTFRYLSALNSFGDSGLSAFGASCAWTDTRSAAAVAAARRHFETCMRGSLAYGPLRMPENHRGGGSLAIGDWPVKIARNCDYRFPIGSHELRRLSLEATQPQAEPQSSFGSRQ